MGGKPWSPAEEAFYWTQVVPFSKKRVGPDKINNNERSWKELATMMQEKMGDEALRDYTHISLMEHWFQNVQEQRYSKHALEYVLAYKEHLIDGEFGAGRKPRRVKKEINSAGQENEVMGDEDIVDEIMEDDDADDNDVDMGRGRIFNTPSPLYDASPIQSAAASPASLLTPASPVEPPPTPAALQVPAVSVHNPFSVPFARLSPARLAAAGADGHSPAIHGNILPPINRANGHGLAFRGDILPPINEVDNSFHAFQQSVGNGNHDYGIPGYGIPGYGIPGYGIPGYGIPEHRNPGYGRYGHDNHGYGFGDPGGPPRGNYHGYASGSDGDGDGDNDHVRDVNPGNPHVPPSYESHSFANENIGLRNTPGQRPAFGVGPRVPPPLQSMVDRAVTSSVVRLLNVGFRVNDFGEYNLVPPVPVVQPWARNYLAEQEALRVGIAAVEPPQPAPRTPPFGAHPQVVPDADIPVPSIETDDDQQPAVPGHSAAPPAVPHAHLDPNLVAASNALIGLLQAPGAHQVEQQVEAPESVYHVVDPDRAASAGL